MLGEGRHWWVTANSDSHVHYSEGGVDFWPGEYSKTHVWAEKNHDAILDGIRHGRVFVTTGDLISALEFSVNANGVSASLGDELVVDKGAEIEAVIRYLDPESNNARGENPSVARIDLIWGDLTGIAEDRSNDSNPTTRVQQRFAAHQFSSEGGMSEVRIKLRAERSGYFRLRGTNGEELEPTSDEIGEDPWSDLWFYSNPIFVRVAD
jgi:hypothetical protein